MVRPVAVGVAASPESSAAVEWAAREAFRLELPLRLVHVLNWSPHHSSDAPTEAEGAAAGQPARRSAVLDQAMAQVHRTCPEVAVTGDVVEGPASAALLRVAGQAGLLVVGSRGLGAVSGAVVGSVARSVAAASPVPVVLVRAPGPGDDTTRAARGREAPGTEVVLGLDLSDPCDPVIEFAFRAAEGRRARLHAVSAWRGPALFTLGPGEVGLVGGERRGQEWRGFQEAVLRSWRSKFPEVTVASTLTEGRPTTPLLDAAAGAGLLVVGRRVEEGHPLGHHNGPVARAAMHHARCPVVIVPHS